MNRVFLRARLVHGWAVSGRPYGTAAAAAAAAAALGSGSRMDGRCGEGGNRGEGEGEGDCQFGNNRNSRGISCSELSQSGRPSPGGRARRVSSALFHFVRNLSPGFRRQKKRISRRNRKSRDSETGARTTNRQQHNILPNKVLTETESLSQE